MSNPNPGSFDIQRLLQLLQFADSALPVGALSHSFGLESMVDDGLLDVSGLFHYLEDLLAESLLVEAVFCRSAHTSSGCSGNLRELNTSLSALRQARETREASLALGKRLLGLAAALELSPLLSRAAAHNEAHYSIAFGFVCGVLAVDPELTVAAFLHQNVLAFLSSAQRLLPLGQIQSSRMAWELKPAIQAAVERSAAFHRDKVCAFSHLPELASMRHPFLATRLFIS